MTYRLASIGLSVVGLSCDRKSYSDSMARTGRPRRKAVDRAFMREMGTRLRWVREALELTQTEAANRVGVHQTAWSKWETGARWPDQFEMPRLAGKLRITLEYLRDGSLQGVERELAIRLAALHPELVLSSDKDSRRDTDLS